GENEVAGGFQILITAEAGGQLVLFLTAQHGDAADAVGIGLEAAQRTCEQGIGAGGEHGGCTHDGEPPSWTKMDLSTRWIGVPKPPGVPLNQDITFVKSAAWKSGARLDAGQVPGGGEARTNESQHAADAQQQPDVARSGGQQAEAAIGRAHV